MKQNDTYLTTPEVEKLLKVCRVTLYRWRKDKKIKSKKIAGTIRYKFADIEKLMQ